MVRKEGEVLKDIEHVSNEINATLKEYANYCYDFYMRPNNDWLVTSQMELTEEMILNDNQLSDEEKEQSLYFLSLPTDWESIHKKYCSALKSLHDKSMALDDELRLVKYNENMDKHFNSLKE